MLDFTEWAVRNRPLPVRRTLTGAVVPFCDDARSRERAVRVAGNARIWVDHEPSSTRQLRAREPGIIALRSPSASPARASARPTPHAGSASTTAHRPLRLRNPFVGVGSPGSPDDDPRGYSARGASSRACPGESQPGPRRPGSESLPARGYSLAGQTRRVSTRRGQSGWPGDGWRGRGALRLGGRHGSGSRWRGSARAGRAGVGAGLWPRPP